MLKSSVASIEFSPDDVIEAESAASAIRQGLWPKVIDPSAEWWNAWPTRINTLFNTSVSCDGEHSWECSQTCKRASASDVDDGYRAYPCQKRLSSSCELLVLEGHEREPC